MQIFTIVILQNSLNCILQSFPNLTCVKLFKGPFKCIYLGKQLECTLLDSSFATCNKANKKMTIKRQLLPNYNNNRNENNNWMIVPSFLLQRKDEENYGNLIATMYTTGNC